MPGGLLQLLNYGYEDKVLIDRPEITHFKLVYRQHSNFSLQDIPLLFKNAGGFGANHVVNIPNHGDLLRGVTLCVELPRLEAYYPRSVEEEIVANMDRNVFSLSGAAFNFIRERFREMRAYLNNTDRFVPALVDGIVTNVFNWLDDNPRLLRDVLTTNTWDYRRYGMTTDRFVSPERDATALNPYDQELSRLNYMYGSVPRERLYDDLVSQFYLPTNMQFLVPILMSDVQTLPVQTSYDLYNRFLDLLYARIVTTRDLDLVRYLEEKQRAYAVTSLDEREHSSELLQEVRFSTVTSSDIEPVMYFYRATANADGSTSYALSDIVINKKTSRSNQVVTVNTEHFSNNYGVIEAEIQSNTFIDRIYFVGSRPQIVYSQDMLQLLKVRFIKSRRLRAVNEEPFGVEWDIVYTNDPAEAIEWEAKIIGDVNEFGFVPPWDAKSNPLNREAYDFAPFSSNIGVDASVLEAKRNVYLAYVYAGIRPEEQDILDLQGKYFSDNSQVKYFIDASDNYIPVRAYFTDPTQRLSAKRSIPVIHYTDFTSGMELKYNARYFLDGSANFVTIKDVYFDENGRTAILVDLSEFDASGNERKYTYYVDPQGNYVGPIFSDADISGNYYIPIAADFVVDLIGRYSTDLTLVDQTDISRNLIPVYNFINKKQTFQFVYKGKYYNFLNVYYESTNKPPSNLVDEFPYYPPFCVMAVQTWYEDKIVLRKVDLPGVSEADRVYHTPTLFVRQQQDDRDTNRFCVIGNTMLDYAQVDLSANQLRANTEIDAFDIRDQEVYKNGEFAYFWLDATNTLVDPTNDVTFQTYEYWQDHSIPLRARLGQGDLDNFRFLSTQTLQRSNINLEVYENYRHIVKSIAPLNLADYQLFKTVIENVNQTVQTNLSILRNTFASLFDTARFFSQYMSTSNTQITLRSNFVKEHLQRFLAGIIGDASGNLLIDGDGGYYNLFVSRVTEAWHDFMEKQDTLLFKALKEGFAASTDLMRVMNNNQSLPLLKVTINNINNVGLYNKSIFLVLANGLDTSLNPIDVAPIFSQGDRFDNTATVRDYVLSSRQNATLLGGAGVDAILEQVAISDLEALRLFDVFTKQELTSMRFRLDGWGIVEYEVNDAAKTTNVFLVPPSYTEFKKLMALMYLSDNQQTLLGSAAGDVSGNGLYMLFDMTGAETNPALALDSSRRVLRWEHVLYRTDNTTPMDTAYVNKVRNVLDNNDRIVFMNFVLLDLFRDLLHRLLDKLAQTSTRFLLFAQMYYADKLWHMLQDLLYATNTGFNSMASLPTTGNILTINSFAVFYDSEIIMHTVTDMFDSYMYLTVRRLCVAYLHGKTYTTTDGKTIRFYATVLAPFSASFQPTMVDIELTNLNSIDVLQWLVFYICNRLEDYYLPSVKPVDSNVNFWIQFNDYRDTIIKGVTVNAANFFMYLALNDLPNLSSEERTQLSSIFYHFNELMHAMYQVLDKETINDTAKNAVFELVTDATQSQLKFGNIFNMNDYSVYDIMVTFTKQLLGQQMASYKYSYVVDYFKQTKANFVAFYEGIFGNLQSIGLTTYNVFRELQALTGFDWQDYVRQLDHPRRNPQYEQMLDENIQLVSAYDERRIYNRYRLMFRDNLLYYTDRVYIARENATLNTYNTYKQLLALRTVDDTTVIDGFLETFRSVEPSRMFSTKEMRKAIEWAIFSEFSSPYGALKIVNKRLGFYDANNNLVLDYVEKAVYDPLDDHVLLYFRDGLGFLPSVSPEDPPASSSAWVCMVDSYIYSLEEGVTYVEGADGVIRRNGTDPVWRRSGAQLLDYATAALLLTLRDGLGYDASGNLALFSFRGAFLRVDQRLYRITNGVLQGTGPLAGKRSIDRVVYDRLGGTHAIHYQLETVTRADLELNASRVRDQYRVQGDTAFISGILDEVFSESVVTLKDTRDNITTQLSSPEYWVPIALTVGLRNAIFPSSQAWDLFLLASNWNRTIARYGLRAGGGPEVQELLGELLTSIQGYNATKQHAALKLWNVDRQAVVVDPASDLGPNDAFQVFPMVMDYNAPDDTNYDQTDTAVKNLSMDIALELTKKRATYDALTQQQIAELADLAAATEVLKQRLLDGLTDRSAFAIDGVPLVVDGRMYWYLGELITDAEKQAMDAAGFVYDGVRFDRDGTVNATLGVYNGYLIRRTNLPFGFVYDFSSNQIVFDTRGYDRSMMMLAMTYYKWNRFMRTRYATVISGKLAVRDAVYRFDEFVDVVRISDDLAVLEQELRTAGAYAESLMDGSPNNVYVVVEDVVQQRPKVGEYVVVYKSFDAYGPMRVVGVVPYRFSDTDLLLIKVKRRDGFFWEPNTDYKVTTGIPVEQIHAVYGANASVVTKSFSWQEFFRQTYAPLTISGNIVEVLRDLTITLSLSNTALQPPSTAVVAPLLDNIISKLGEFGDEVGQFPDISFVTDELLDISQSLIVIDGNMSYSPTLYNNLSNLTDIYANIGEIVPFTQSLFKLFDTMKQVRVSKLIPQLNTINRYGGVYETLVANTPFIMQFLTNSGTLRDHLAVLKSYFTNQAATDVVAFVNTFDNLFGRIDSTDISENMSVFRDVLDISGSLATLVDTSDSLVYLPILDFEWVRALATINTFSEKVGNLYLVSDVSDNINAFFTLFYEVQGNIQRLEQLSQELAADRIDLVVTLLRDTDYLERAIRVLSYLEGLGGVVDTLNALGTTLDIFTSNIAEALLMQPDPSLNAIQDKDLVNGVRGILINVAELNDTLMGAIDIMNQLQTIGNVLGKVEALKLDTDVLRNYFETLPSISTLARSFPKLFSIVAEKNNLPYAELRATTQDIKSKLDKFYALYLGIKNMQENLDLSPQSQIISKVNLVALQVNGFINFSDISRNCTRFADAMNNFANNNPGAYDAVLSNQKTLRENIEAVRGLLTDYFIRLDFVGTFSRCNSIQTQVPSVRYQLVNVTPTLNTINNVVRILSELQVVEGAVINTQTYDYPEPPFMDILDTMTNFTRLLDNLDELDAVRGLLVAGGAIDNAQLVRDRLDNIYNLITVSDSLNMLDAFLESTELRYKVTQWLQTSRDTLFTVCEDTNLFLDYHDWLYLRSGPAGTLSNPMLLVDKYNIAYNNRSFTLMQVGWKEGDFVFDPSANYEVLSGMGYVVRENLARLSGRVLFDTVANVNRNLLDYVHLFDKYNDFVQPGDTVSILRTMMTDIIDTVPDDHPLLDIPGDNISKAYRHGFNGFRFTRAITAGSGQEDMAKQVGVLASQYVNAFSRKLGNLALLKRIFHRPAVPRAAWVNYLGHYLVERASITLDDALLQELTSDWIHIWAHASMGEGKVAGYHRMIGNTADMVAFDAAPKRARYLYIPLPFYFQNNPGAALPLIALMHSRLAVEVKLRDLSGLVYLEETAALKGNMKPRLELLGSFVYLADHERGLFGRHRHEYLITQVQYKVENIRERVGELRIEFANPVKDMFFVAQRREHLAAKQYYNYCDREYRPAYGTSISDNRTTLESLSDLGSLRRQAPLFFLTGIEPTWWDVPGLASLASRLEDRYPDNPFLHTSASMNGHDRWKDLDGEMTGYVYPRTLYGRTFLPGVNVYSFALRPLSDEPSGACSFSYLNNKRFRYALKEEPGEAVIKLFARSYNILRIASGIGAIAM
jgi:hypothetical protein